MVASEVKTMWVLFVPVGGAHSDASASLVARQGARHAGAS
jgi:hypothetical protein